MFRGRSTGRRGPELFRCILFPAVILSVGISAGTTYAYLRSEDQLVNVLSGTDTQISVEEQFDPPEEIIPGITIPKAPVIHNESGHSCYVRVKIRFSDQAAEELCEPLIICRGWSQKEDGYIYWNEPLGAGESTAPVFEYLKIRRNIPVEDISEFDVFVYAEAASTAEASSAAEAFIGIGG